MRLAAFITAVVLSALASPADAQLLPRLELKLSAPGDAQHDSALAPSSALTEPGLSTCAHFEVGSTEHTRCSLEDLTLRLKDARTRMQRAYPYRGPAVTAITGGAFAIGGTVVLVFHYLIAGLERAIGCSIIGCDPNGPVKLNKSVTYPATTAITLGIASAAWGLLWLRDRKKARHQLVPEWTAMRKRYRELKIAQRKQTAREAR